MPYIHSSEIPSILKETFQHRVFSLLILDGSLYLLHRALNTQLRYHYCMSKSHFWHLIYSFCTPNGHFSTHLREPTEQNSEIPSLSTHFTVTFLHILESSPHSYQAQLLHNWGPSIHTKEAHTTHIIYQSLQNSERSCQILYTDTYTTFTIQRTLLHTHRALISNLNLSSFYTSEFYPYSP